MFPVVVEPGITRDVKHPGFESALVSKRQAILEHPEKDVLDKIFGNGPAARHSDKKIEEGAIMSVEKDSQLGNLAPPYREHQVFVRFRHFVNRKLLFWGKVTRKIGKKRCRDQGVRPLGPYNAFCPGPDLAHRMLKWSLHGLGQRAHRSVVGVCPCNGGRRRRSLASSLVLEPAS